LLESNSRSGGSTASRAQPINSGRAAEIRGWLIEHLAKELEIDSSKIDPDRPLTRYGLDSLAAVTLSGELEVFLKRELSPELLRELPTINSIANRFAEDSENTEAPRQATRYASLDYSSLTSTQRRLQQTIRGLASPLYRIEIQGLQNVPVKGAVIFAANHLHILDAPLIFSLIPRSMVLFASDHMRRVPLVGWFLRNAGNAIYVRRGEADADALACALDVLHAGGGLAVAPEGRISKTGRGLLQGHPGIAHLAVQSGATIVPIAMWGQEKIFRHWLCLSRTPVQIRIGEPLHFSKERATAKQLESHRDTIMRALAALLPESYRGEYR
jgi:1-acyl-sn-glycerol-3-phosphate acyltransferase